MRSLFEMRRPADRLDRDALTPRQRADVLSLIREHKGRFGAVHDVERGTDGGTLIRFKEAVIPARLNLGRRGRVAGLRLSLPQRTTASLADMLREAASLGSGASAAVAVDGQLVGAVRADIPMSVGSAFKLEVLAAYLDAVRDGVLRADAVHRLREAERRPPSGIMQDWPAGLPVTLDTLCLLMLSLSDNTATDILLSRLRLRGVPTTGQVLASLGDADGPRWRRSAADVLETLERVCYAPQLACNPGPLSDLDAAWVNYKGGMVGTDVCFAGAAQNAGGRRVSAVLIVNGMSARLLEAHATLFLNFFTSSFRHGE